MKPALFVSDLHLSAARPEMVARFLRFLAEEAAAAESLYALGDVFDHWLGDDADAGGDDVNARVLSALSRVAASGVYVGLMHGNRDFLFGAEVARRRGIELLPDPTLREICGTPTLLMHGDLLCTDDVRYQRYRSIVRRPAVVRTYLALPRFVRDGIAARMKRVSQIEKRVKAAPIMDVNPGAVEDALRRHGYPRLVHGHTHRPGRHVHVVDGHACERWVLGDWYERASYLRCDARGCEAILLP